MTGTAPVTFFPVGSGGSAERDFCALPEGAVGLLCPCSGVPTWDTQTQSRDSP